MRERALTGKAIERRARKLRLLAGKLYVEMRDQRLPVGTRDRLRIAHDAACAAFRSFEDAHRL